VVGSELNGPHNLWAKATRPKKACGPAEPAEFEVCGEQLADFIFIRRKISFLQKRGFFF